MLHIEIVEENTQQHDNNIDVDCSKEQTDVYMLVLDSTARTSKLQLSNSRSRVNWSLNGEMWKKVSKLHTFLLLGEKYFTHFKIFVKA